MSSFSAYNKVFTSRDDFYVTMIKLVFFKKINAHFFL